MTLLLDSCGALTRPRSHKSLGSDLNLDLPEEASGRLCTAHSSSVWGGTAFYRLCPGNLHHWPGLEVLAGRCVFLCYDPYYWVSRTSPQPLFSSGTSEALPLNLELGSCIREDTGAWSLWLGSPHQKPLCWERNRTNNYFAGQGYILLLSYYFSTGKMKKIIFKTSREPWDFESNYLQNKQKATKN